MADDLYAPMSDEEKQLYSPITKEELAQFNKPKARSLALNPQHIGLLQAGLGIENNPEEQPALDIPTAAVNAVDSFTLGAGSRLAGAGAAVAAKLGGIDFEQQKKNLERIQAANKQAQALGEEGFDESLAGPQSMGDVYSANKQAFQQTQDEMTAANPKSAIAGQLAGGFLGAGMTKGYGALPIAEKMAGILGAEQSLVSAGKAAYAAGKVATEAGEGFLGATKAVATPLLKTAATEVAGAAPMGAISGYMHSKPGQEAEGAWEGAKEGSILALVTKAAFEGVPWAVQAIREKSAQGIGNLFKAGIDAEVPALMRQEAYEAGLRGENWNSEAFQKGETQAAIS